LIDDASVDHRNAEKLVAPGRTERHPRADQHRIALFRAFFSERELVE
jgi:hypothetical protein